MSGVALRAASPPPAVSGNVAVNYKTNNFFHKEAVK
jgi:hypothetical protein